MDHHQPASPGPRSHARSFSFRSDKSGNSSGKANIDDLTESPREKERRDSIWKNTSKANPNAAMIEAQPGEVNLIEKTTIEPLRNFQHKDVRGNVITDPDLSNPTRPRMERPLDTIRSFEKAIDTGYKRRSSMMRSESYNDQNGSQYASRRSSYYGGHNDHQRGRPQPSGGYYSQRPDSYAESNGQGHPRMRYDGRMQSESAVPRSNGWPQHVYHQSHDTVGTTGTNGSDSTGPWANSTDPSSENSSIDRRDLPTKPYAGHDVIAEEGIYTPHQSYDSRPPPTQQRLPSANQPRRPVPLNSTSHKLPPVPPKPEPDRRQSWLKRRFSKKL